VLRVMCLPVLKGNEYVRIVMHCLNTYLDAPSIKSHWELQTPLRNGQLSLALASPENSSYVY
jgi:hypothetical protein